MRWRRSRELATYPSKLTRLERFLSPMYSMRIANCSLLATSLRRHGPMQPALRFGRSDRSALDGIAIPSVGYSLSFAERPDQLKVTFNLSKLVPEGKQL